MMTFSYQFDSHTPKITMELSPETVLPDALGAFESFLIAVGYVFQGHVDIIPVDEPITEEVN